MALCRGRMNSTLRWIGLDGLVPGRMNSTLRVDRGMVVPWSNEFDPTGGSGDGLVPWSNEFDPAVDRGGWSGAVVE